MINFSLVCINHVKLSDSFCTLAELSINVISTALIEQNSELHNRDRNNLERKSAFLILRDILYALQNTNTMLYVTPVVET